MASRKKPDDGMKPNNTLVLNQSREETGAQAMARKVLEPTFKNAAVASSFTDKLFGKIELPGVGDYAEALQAVADKAAEGDLAFVSKTLAAQAVALDSMFAELARRTAMNMGEYINAAERYGRLALKAQSNCRATLEALTKLHQPREQIVKHVHVNEGGQAVVADHVHHHSGDAENAKTGKQSHATGAAGQSAALPSPDPLGRGVPISSRSGEAALQNARRDKSRSARGKQ